MKALHTALLTAVLGIAVTGSASASPIWAVGSVSFNNVASGYVGANLASATQISMDNAGVGNIASTVGVFRCGAVPHANCVPALADPIPVINPQTITPATFSVPLLNSYSSFVVWGDGTVLGATRYSFSVVSSTVGHLSSDDLTIFANGVFHDSLGVFYDSKAKLIFSLTQSGGPGDSISWAGSISTQASPEPATLGLFGGALLALGLIRRRKTA